MRTFGLIGYPLGHSFSREYFNRKFLEEGISNARYLNFPLKDIEELPLLLKNEPTLSGLNVTIPYKKTVIPLLDHLDETARIAEAVNTILISGAGLTGFNTDLAGFDRSITPLIGPAHRAALILGTGGGAAAVACVLREKSIPFLFVSRNPQTPDTIGYQDIDESLLSVYPVVINCTPAGMYPDSHESPGIPYELLGTGNLLYDLVYNPAETVFLKKGKAAGAQVKNGMDMLVLQAEESWKIWNQLPESI